MFLEKQQQAHDLYFNTDKTQQEIADILDVNRRTIYLWVKQGRWAEMKAAARQMPSIIQQNLYNYINAVSDKINKRDEDDRCPTMEEVEKMRKLLNMANSIGKKHTGAYIEAFQELQLFIFNRDAALATQLREHIADYARGTVGDKDFIARKRRKDNVLDVTTNLAKQEMQDQENAGGCEEQDEIFCDKNTPVGTAAALHFQSVETLPGNHANTYHAHGPAGTDIPLSNNCVGKTQGAECDNDGIFRDKIAPAKNSDTTIERMQEPAPVKDIKEILSISETANYTAEDFAEHGIFVPGGAGDEPDDDPVHFGRAMELPPHMRPSPFIVGDTVWILHPDHLESRLDTYGNEWGPIKMNHSIRYYPDVDPANTKAA